MEYNNQIIQDVKFISFEEIQRMDQNIIHNIFNLVKHPKELLELTGYVPHKSV
jgi:hypothetical protein